MTSLKQLLCDSTPLGQLEAKMPILEKRADAYIKELQKHFNEKAKEEIESTSTTTFQAMDVISPDHVMIRLSEVLRFLRGEKTKP